MKSLITTFAFLIALSVAAPAHAFGNQRTSTEWMTIAYAGGNEGNIIGIHIEGPKIRWNNFQIAIGHLSGGFGGDYATWSVGALGVGFKQHLDQDIEVGFTTYPLSMGFWADKTVSSAHTGLAGDQALTFFQSQIYAKKHLGGVHLIAGINFPLLWVGSVGPWDQERLRVLSFWGFGF